MRFLADKNPALGDLSRAGYSDGQTMTRVTPRAGTDHVSDQSCGRGLNSALGLVGLARRDGSQPGAPPSRSSPYFRR